MKRVEKKKNDDKGNVSVSVVAGDFPLTQFLKWDESCKSDFNDIRWVKMMSDHEKARMYELLVRQLIREHIVEVNDDDKAWEPPQNEEAKEKVVSLIGGAELREELEETKNE